MSVRAAMSLCRVHHAFLYQVRPDICPQGFLTDVELELWGRFYDEREKM